MVSKKTFFFYASIFAATMALSACGRGFTTKDEAKKKSPAETAADTTIPVQVTSYNIIPLTDLAAATEPKVAAIVNDPANKGKNLKVTAEGGFYITKMDPNGQLSGQDSELILTIEVADEAERSAIATISVTNPQLALTKSANGMVEISGYWTIQPPGANVYPFYVGIQASVVASGEKTLLLKGSLFAVFDGSQKSILAEFDEDICGLVNEPENIASAHFPNTAFECFAD